MNSISITNSQTEQNFKPIIRSESSLLEGSDLLSTKTILHHKSVSLLSSISNKRYGQNSDDLYNFEFDDQSTLKDSNNTLISLGQLSQIETSATINGCNLLLGSNNSISFLQRQKNASKKTSDFEIENAKMEYRIQFEKISTPGETFAKSVKIFSSNSSQNLFNLSKIEKTPKNFRLTKVKPPSKKEHPFKHLIFGTPISAKDFSRYLKFLIIELKYCLKGLRSPAEEYIKTREISINASKATKPNKTLLLDLDETLIHCNGEIENAEKFMANNADSLPFKIRPFAHEFLVNMSKYYEIIIFTAASSKYAELIINHLDPTHTLISEILDRRFCLETKHGYFIKDLRIIKNRELSNMILIDNLVHSFGFQLDNGIPILEWKGDTNDQELKYLQDYLIELSQYDNLQIANREKLKLTELEKYNFDEFCL